eukprot:TRINITY_DN11601_c0_g1::TRINITY_DN11601_c0_g1_i1::g.21983::m.21983 TRINITY_DN11601_c0_g1::TRINITY_DN11601_c0_g1_i1::g.21983  ORF type:complete len:198 (+),score=41.10,sp/Q9SN68/RAF2B_ARATH/52.36/4e-62,Ras/PF00071.17/4.8e-52,Miro/PF08477.8/1.8e-18,Arf/PF00025.16/3.3e-10,Gtr1_RagA/PF04670.7/8.3e-07,MMR_HSR1/PF01926.18/7.2e-06,GTP_EFTU/PF00009.22/0.0013,DUF258/PF03193.11/0.0013,NTPase_1/PF03266.10/0.0027,SRPRB/PF09439.5/0.0069,ABC_tran/PF00005.22/0.011,DUF815/PF05673.8/0.091,DUF815/PF05673.8/4.2e+02
MPALREEKVVLLGDTGVGKSSLVLRFVTNQYRDYSESTIGASFLTKTVRNGDESIKFQIWDTAGQEKYHSLAPIYYRNASIAILVFDLGNLDSFKTLKSWVTELQENGPTGIIIALAGNKLDLYLNEASRAVSLAVAQAYAKEIGATYTETSAKDDTGVTELFLSTTRRLPPVSSTAKPTPSLQDLTLQSGNASKCC